MKNFLKKANLIIITLLCTTLVGTKNVAAFENCEEAVAKGYTCKMVNGKPIVAAPSGSYNAGKTTEFTKAKENVKTFGDLNIYIKNADGSPLAGSSTYKYYSYTGTADNAGNPVYCLDANKGGATNLYASRFLADNFNNREGEKSINTYIHDIAVMEILTSKGNVDPSSDEYRAVSLAIRSVNQLFGLSQTTSANTKECEYAYLVNGQDKEACLQSKANDGVLTKAIVGTMRDWVANGDEGIKSSYNTIRGAIPGGAFFDVNNNENTNGYTLADDGGTLIKEAQALFKQALEKASQVASNVTESSSANVTFSSGEVLNGGVQVQNTANGELRLLDMKYNFKLSNFTNDKKARFTFNSLSYTDGAETVGASGEPKIVDITVNGTSICNGECSLGQNILENIAINGNAEISVTVRFEGYSDDLKCGGQPMKFNLGYSFSDSNASNNLFPGYTGVVWYARNDKQGKITNDQRYISVTKNEDATEELEAIDGSLDGEINLKENCDCTALKEACEASGSLSSDECNEFFEAGCSACDELDIECNMGGDKEACKQHDENCDFTCDTYFDTFECCDSNNDLIVSTNDDKEVKVLGPGPDNPDADSIKACFVSKIDDQKTVDANGNSEKGYTGATGVKDQKDNTYTSHQLAENKYCVVSCKEDYIMTMPTAKMVNAGRYFTFKAKVEGTKVCYTNTIDREQYNKDMNAAQVKLVEAFNEYLRTKTATETSITSKTEKCCSECGGTYTNYYLNSVSPYSYTPIENEDTGVISISKSSGLSYEDEDTGDSNCPCAKNGCGDDGRECCYDKCEYCKSGNSEALKQRAKDAFNDAKNELAAAQENYRKIIDEYAECSNWNSEINYDPEVYYDYQETYLNKYGLIGQMEESLSEINNSDWFCNSIINPGSGNVSTKGELLDKNYEHCNNNSNGYHETSLDYIYCDELDNNSENGCHIVPKNVSDVRYMKISSAVSANYKPSTLFYNVYPSGEIVINSADNNVALENSLPVSLNTDRGIYKYTVNVNNLGEFYDESSKDNLGRYSGSPTAVISENALVYSCAYLVNMISEDGWTCKFNDTCTDDCINGCVGPNCGDDYCEGGDCIHECIGVGCIYDTNAGSSILEKKISLNNMFPNGTNSYNWSKDKNAKAAAAIEAIEGAGNSIYDGTPIFSITMNGSSAAEVRRYNKSVENEGGYSNHTLDCYQLGGYEEIACYSKFVSDYMNGTYGGSVNESVASEYRNVGDNNTEYFSLWNGSISDKIMIGPSYQ